ncbi:hypothetical protein [Cryobacterium sp. TMT1-19]|uniref:hypothetical protein n=1 Tax=Cryobacterium sp. TMT1-19 TaxID=1259231 RepID=UPI00351360BF
MAELVAASGAEPAELEVIRPSLEDIYLGLVRGNRAPSDDADADADADAKSVDLLDDDTELLA